MQELGALRMGGVLEDGAALAPSDKKAVFGDRDVEGSCGQHADAAAEGCGVGAVGLADECDRSGGAADPARPLGEELLKPAVAVLTNAVVLCLVLMSYTISRMLVVNSRQVKCKEHRVVIVGVRKD